MGWTGTDRWKGQSQLEYFAPKFDYSKADGSYGKCIAAASTLQACYIAYELGDSSGAKKVVALVIGLHYLPRKEDWETFQYKEMDESMGPCEKTCPEKILKLLTPLDPADPSNKYAIEWREACWERIRKAKERQRFKPGEFIEFAEEFKFTNGFEASIFKVIQLKPRLVLHAISSTGERCSVRLSWNHVKRVTYKLVTDPSKPVLPAPPASIPLSERLAGCKPSFQPELF